MGVIIKAEAFKMAMVFYPHQDELETSTIEQKLEVILEAAERFKAIILDATKAPEPAPAGGAKKRMTPREIANVFNWEEIALLLRQIREMPENNPPNKAIKADRLTKLSEIYEVLRGAKMSKLEAVRLALVNEANQLRGTTQVA